LFVVGLLVVFLASSSLEFLAKRFLDTYARETLINEWETQGMRSVNGYIPWVVQIKRKTVGGKLR
jgi:hypothetical protein